MRIITQSFDFRDGMEKDTYEIFHYRDAKMQPVPLHRHNYNELYFFISGNVDYRIEGHTYSLVPGDILLISPMEFHQPLVSQGHSYERIVLSIREQYLASLSAEGFHYASCYERCRKERHNLLRPSAESALQIKARIQELLHETYSQEPGSAMYADALFRLLMIEVNRIAAQKNLQHAATRPSNLISRVLDYICDHYCEPLSLDGIANHFYIDKYHLCHEFNRATGISLYRYIMQKRLVLAKQLLMHGVSASKTYHQCGFNHYSNFYRAFTKEFGISPKTYIKSVIDQRRPDAAAAV